MQLVTKKSEIREYLDTCINSYLSQGVSSCVQAVDSHILSKKVNLLSMANTKDKEIKQGVGWAAKTTAKFHPDIIDAFHGQIQNREEVANWFRTKIDIGLNRKHYAKRN